MLKMVVICLLQLWCLNIDIYNVMKRENLILILMGRMKEIKK